MDHGSRPPCSRRNDPDFADDAKILLRGLSQSGGHFTSHQILPVQLTVIGSVFKPRRR